MARSEGMNALLGKAREKRTVARAGTKVPLEQRRSFLGGLGAGGQPSRGTTKATSTTAAPSEPAQIEQEARAIEQVADSAPAQPASQISVVAEPQGISKHADSISLVADEGESLLGDFESEGLLKKASTDLFRAESPHPVSLVRELFDLFGEDWTSWEPEMLWREVLEERGHEPTRTNKDTILAVLSLLVTENFWNEHHLFLWTVEALNGRSPDFGSLPEPRPEELAFAIQVANEVRDNHTVHAADGSPLASGVYYGHDVVGAIATILFLHGIVWAPPPFQGHGATDQETDLVLPNVNDSLAALMDESGRALATRISRVWAIIESQGIEDIEAEDETEEAVQVAHLVSIREYVRTHAR